MCSYAHSITLRFVVQLCVAVVLLNIHGNTDDIFTQLLI